jgi:hypothetical protein
VAKFFQHDSGFACRVKVRIVVTWVTAGFSRRTLVHGLFQSYGGSGKGRGARIHIMSVVTICLTETRRCSIAKQKTCRVVVVSNLDLKTRCLDFGFFFCLLHFQ